MRTNLPSFQTVFADYNAALSKQFFVRAYPDPNQNGNLGGLVDVSAATFSTDLRDLFDSQFVGSGGTLSLTGYLSGNTSGIVTLSAPQSFVQSLPVGTHRYKIAMSYGGGPMIPFWAGPFVVSGPTTLSNSSFVASNTSLGTSQGYVTTNTGGTTIPAGGAAAPGLASSGGVQVALAYPGTAAIGVAAGSMAYGSAGAILTGGALTLGDWTAVTGGAYLTPDAPYFLSPFSPGKLTATPPTTTGQIVQQVGIAQSTTTLMIAVSSPILL